MKKDSKKTLWVLSLASFLNDAGSDMIAPIWPVFVTGVLGANMAVLGLIDGLGEAIVSISQAVSGYISDRIRKRKVFIWTGYGFAAIARLGYAFSSTWQHIIPFKILDRSGKIRGAPRDAMIADISDHHNRGKNFGILESLDNLGAVFGIIASILLVGFLGYRNLFLLASVPSIIAVFLVIIYIKEKPDGHIRLYKGIALKDINPNLRLFLILSAFFALGSFSYSFLLLYARQFGFRIITIPILYLLYTLVASILSIRFGKMADKLGSKPVVFLSYAFWLLTLLFFLLFRNQVGVVFGFILYGLHLAALDPVKKKFVAELASPDYRASTLGAYQMIIGLCALPASLLAGILWDKISLTAPLYFSLFMTIIAGGMLLFVKETQR